MVTLEEEGLTTNIHERNADSFPVWAVLLGEVVAREILHGCFLHYNAGMRCYPGRVHDLRHYFAKACGMAGLGFLESLSWLGYSRLEP